METGPKPPRPAPRREPQPLEGHPVVATWRRQCLRSLFGGGWLFWLFVAPPGVVMMLVGVVGRGPGIFERLVLTAIFPVLLVGAWYVRQRRQEQHGFESDGSWHPSEARDRIARRGVGLALCLSPLLERRAAAGDVEAAGELLLLRHQAGALPEERLRLAAHMGDAGAVIAARRLLGVEPKRQGLGPWVRTIGTPRLKDWGRELPWVPLVQPVCLRVAIVAAEQGLAVWGSQAWRDGVDQEDGDTRYLEAVLDDAKAWLARSEPWSGRPMDDPIRQRLWGWNAGEGLPSDVALELSSVVCQPVSPGARAAHAKERDTARSAAFVAERAAQALVWASGKGAEALMRAAMQQRAVAWLLRA